MRRSLMHSDCLGAVLRRTWRLAMTTMWGQPWREVASLLSLTYFLHLIKPSGQRLKGRDRTQLWASAKRVLDAPESQ